MGTGINYEIYMYQSPMIYRYYKTLPLWRRIKMKFSENSRIRKEEYDKWFYEIILTGKFSQPATTKGE